MTIDDHTVPTSGPRSAGNAGRPRNISPIVWREYRTLLDRYMHGQRSVIPPDASQPLKQAAVHLMLHVSRETQNVGGYPVEELDEPDQLVAEIEAERRETNDYTQTIMDDYQ